MTQSMWKTSRMSKAQADHLKSIRIEEEIVQQEEVIRNDLKATQRSRWSETLEEASEKRRLKGKMEETQRELKLANKALTEVRRAQLRDLLLAEKKQFEDELHSIGLTFYKDRL